MIFSEFFRNKKEEKKEKFDAGLITCNYNLNSYPN